MRSVCTELHLTHVPVEEIDKNLPEKYPDVGALLERAEGKYPYGGWKEGIVVRPCEPCKSKITGEYLSIKIVNKSIFCTKNTCSELFVLYKFRYITYKEKYFRSKKKCEKR